MDVSLFKRLSERHPHAVISLEHQYRMNQDIMELSNTLIYEHRLKCGTEGVARAVLELPDWDELVSYVKENTTGVTGRKVTCFRCEVLCLERYEKNLKCLISLSSRSWKSRFASSFTSLSTFSLPRGFQSPFSFFFPFFLFFF